VLITADDTERYQGVVALEGATLADCAHHYFRMSEQIETGIKLAVERVGNGEQAHWRAAGLMVQQMPSAELHADIDADEREERYKPPADLELWIGAHEELLAAVPLLAAGLVLPSSRSACRKARRTCVGGVNRNAVETRALSVFRWVSLAFFVFITAFPLVYMISLSFKDIGKILQSPSDFLPSWDEISGFETYRSVLRDDVLQVPEGQLVLEPELDPGHRLADLARHELRPTAW